MTAAAVAGPDPEMPPMNMATPIATSGSHSGVVGLPLFETVKLLKPVVS